MPLFLNPATTNIADRLAFVIAAFITHNTSSIAERKHSARFQYNWSITVLAVTVAYVFKNAGIQIIIVSHRGVQCCRAVFQIRTKLFGIIIRNK